jgi:two-component system response regulator AtoC
VLIETPSRLLPEVAGLDELLHLRRDEEALAADVRELENAVARLVALSRGGTLGPEALDAPPIEGEAPAKSADPPGERTLRERVAGFERDLIAQALERTDNNQSAAARELGISRVTLIDKMKRHGLLPTRR